MTKVVELGHIKNLTCKITAPVTMDIDMELKNINIIVGMNASGKSLMLKLNWTLGTIMSSFLKISKVLYRDQLVEFAQYVFDKSFEKQDFNGTIGATFETNGVELGKISVVFDEGKIISLDYSFDPSVNEATPPVFMSTNLRTFTQIDQYLKTEKLVKSQEDMLTMYRLYDVAFIERLKVKLNGGMKVPNEAKKSLKETFELKIDLEVVSIENDSVVFTNSTGETKGLATLSNGEQSLINMILANY